jgi:hypothetical protein
MTSLTSHQFNDKVINQLAEDTVIGGVIVPKGYINATEMCKANGKQMKDWNKNKSSEALLQAYFSKGVESPPLIAIGNEESFEFRGTWVSFPLAMNIAQWCSAEFAVWSGEVLSLVIKGDFKTLTHEAQLAKENLDKIWQEVRDAGKVSRRGLTDAIKDWYARNPNGTSRPQHLMYAVTTNKIYQALWDMDALQLEKHLDCNRNESRNYLDAVSLKLLARAEENVMDYIDDDNIKPLDAVPLANIRKAKVLPEKLQ